MTTNASTSTLSTVTHNVEFLLDDPLTETSLEDTVTDSQVTDKPQGIYFVDDASYIAALKEVSEKYEWKECTPSLLASFTDWRQPEKMAADDVTVHYIPLDRQDLIGTITLSRQLHDKTWHASKMEFVLGWSKESLPAPDKVDTRTSGPKVLKYDLSGSKAIRFPFPFDTTDKDSKLGYKTWADALRKVILSRNTQSKKQLFAQHLPEKADSVLIRHELIEKAYSYSAEYGLKTPEWTALLHP